MVSHIGHIRLLFFVTYIWDPVWIGVCWLHVCLRGIPFLGDKKILASPMCNPVMKSLTSEQERLSKLHDTFTQIEISEKYGAAAKHFEKATELMGNASSAIKMATALSSD